LACLGWRTPRLTIDDLLAMPDTVRRVRELIARSPRSTAAGVDLDSRPIR
jgi:hypothetical protein